MNILEIPKSNNPLKSDKINEAIEKRAHSIVNQLKFPFIWKRFYIAGGCLTGDINDIDIFLPTDVEYLQKDYCGIVLNDDEVIPQVISNTVLSETANATTYESTPWTTQVCRYYYPTLKELVESFDFAHIQVGAEIRKDRLSDTPYVSEIYYSNRFVESNVIKSTWYVKSEYPMSSLIRAAKYYQRGLFTKGGYVACVLSILGDVVSRGFKGYEDFKDQLDAVDLGLLPEEFKDIEQGHDKLVKLFHALDKGEPPKTDETSN